MTVSQKVIAVVGLIVGAATIAFAPYDYMARELISGASVDGDVYTPLGNADAAVRKELDAGSEAKSVWVIETRLATGRLALWWAATTAITVVALVIAAPTRRNSPAS